MMSDFHKQLSALASLSYFVKYQIMQMMKERGGGHDTVSVFHFLFWRCYGFSVTYSAFEWRDILFFSAALAFIRSVLIVISVA